MKYKQHPKIQALVDNLKGSKITHLTALHIPAARFTDEVGSISQAASDAHANGVYNGIILAQKFIKAKERIIAKYGEGNSASFGIYLATQETSDGDDYLYFIGTPEQIIKKLEKVY